MAEPIPNLSNYRIHSRLSSGGMGAVFLAEDLKLRRQVAIKALTPEWATEPDRVRRFQREARVLATLNHPNIVTIHGIEEEDGTHFLIMELVEGKTLAQLIPSVGMPAEQVLRLAVPLADALAAAHEGGVIHRDLKPGNIMVSDDGRVKILDFGLAKWQRDSRRVPAPVPTDAREPVTRAGQMMGTVPYMSPEQVQGEAIDHRSDIFSLGVILYEMATGKRPFDGESWADLASSILRDNPPSVTSLNVYLPRHLGRIVRHCLEKDPLRRFQTALDLRNELEELEREVLSGELSVTRNDLAELLSTVHSEPPKRDPEKLLAVAATVLVLAIVIAILWLRSGREPPAPPPTSAPPGPTAVVESKRIVVLPFENLGPAEDAYFAAGMTEEITSRLGSVSALSVISRSTALNYNRAEKTAQEIGQDLGVDFLVEGTVRWSNADGGESRVRVTPQLIRTADDTQVWSSNYNRVIDDLFAVQEEIAAEVIRQLGIALRDPERQALGAQPTASFSAYQAYLRGQDHASRRDPTRANWELAVQMFERAVELDPGFAIAWAGLSEAHSMMYHWMLDRSPERLEKARSTADRALAIAPHLPEGHRALGYYYYRGFRDYPAALQEFDLAAQALPNDSELLEGIAYIRRRQGRFDDAVENLRQALERRPESDWIAAELGQTLTVIRRYQQANHYYERAIALAPDRPAPYRAQALNHLLWRGDTAAARRVLNEMPRPDSAISVLAWFHLEVTERNYPAALKSLHASRAQIIGIESVSYPKDLLRAFVFRRMGETSLARDAFENARLTLERRLPEETDDFRSRIALGLAYAGLGRKEDAIREGRRAVEEYPISRDAFIGPRVADHLAKIYIMVGDYEAALDQIESLLSMPAELSVPFLRLAPQWDGLRDHPRFIEIVGEPI